MYWRQSHRFCPGLLWKHDLILRSSHCSWSIKNRKTSVLNSFFNRVAVQETRMQMFSCEVYEIFKNWCLPTTASEACCFTWSFLKLAQIATWFSLREKCPNTYFFLVRFFPHSDWIRRDTLRIQSECEKIRTRKISVFGHFLSSVLYYNLQFRSPILPSLLILLILL